MAVTSYIYYITLLVYLRAYNIWYLILVHIVYVYKLQVCKTFK